MKSIDVMVVRVYITESSHLLNKILNYLRTDAKIRGVSVFRAISGFGETENHISSLIDVSLNLPLIVEFFDRPNHVEPVLTYLNQFIKPEHIIFWHAQANESLL